MSREKTRNQNFNIPNSLSVLRIFIIPFFAYYYLIDELFIAIIFIVISGLSDAVDGYIARRFNQITELGKLLDPFADKLTQITLAVCLAIKFPILIPLLCIFFVKEILMLILASFLIKKEKKPTAAKWYGKVATILFYFSVIIIVALDSFKASEILFDWVSISLLSITAVMMIYSAIKYFAIFRKLIVSDRSEDKIQLGVELKTKRKI